MILEKPIRFVQISAMRKEWTKRKNGNTSLEFHWDGDEEAKEQQKQTTDIVSEFYWDGNEEGAQRGMRSHRSSP